MSESYLHSAFWNEEVGRHNEIANLILKSQATLRDSKCTLFVFLNGPFPASFYLFSSFLHTVNSK